MKCPNCSFEIADNSTFCSNCARPVLPGIKYLEDYLNDKLQKAITEQFKDQNLVAKETSAQVLTKVTSRAQLYVALIAVIMALLGFGTYREFSQKITDAAKVIQPQIDKATAEAGKAVDTAGQAKGKVDKVIQDLKEDIKHASALDSDATKLSDKIGTTNAQIDARMREFNAKVSQSPDRINVDEITNTIFSKITSVAFAMNAWSANPAGPSPLEVLDHGDVQAIYMILPDPPMTQTLQVQWGLFLLPKYEVGSDRNVVQFRWNKKDGDLHLNSIYVSYVPNITEKLRFKNLVVRDNTVYADGAFPLGKYWPGKN
jgi:hypothetical protein